MNALRTRTALAGVQPYVRPYGAGIDLSDNTNRWGAAPSALALIEDGSVSLSRYPDAYADELKRAVAAYLDVDPAMVTTGCGSDGVLDAAIRAFGEPGERIAIPEPTFPLPCNFARVCSLEPVMIPLNAVYQPDAEAIARVSPRIVYLCSPNNPLGASIPEITVRAVAESTDGLVIVDEAYAEFAGASVVGLASELPNLLVTRTMSKAFGLAALRVGYAIGSAALVREVERVRGPYAVSALAVTGAAAALRNDVPWMRERVTLACEARERLRGELVAMGFDTVTSAANFVLVPRRDAPTVADRMRARGVAIRPFTGLRPVSPALEATGGDALRITVGPEEEMRDALDALGAAMREEACV